MNTYLSHKERLEQILHYTKKTQSGLARELAVPQPNINAVLTGKSTEMSKKVIVAILKQYGEIDAYWLLTGEGEMLKGKRGEKKYEGPEGGDTGVREPTGPYEKGQSVLEWMERYVALQEKYIALREEYMALKERCRDRGDAKKE